ncbi:MAG: SMC-Scp complex subunit ScpB [Bacteroidales bacterium]|nr:SMC-Scp complex subunit ScpB [Bacteroidales bacterium]
MIHHRPKWGPQTWRGYHRRPGNVRPPLSVRTLTGVRTRETANDPLARDDQIAKLEAVLFLADEPLPAKILCRAVGLRDTHAVEHLLDRYQALLDADGAPIHVFATAGGYQLVTRPVFFQWLLRLRRTGSGVEFRLTAAQMETLAVIAYKQPVTRAELESVRGVACGDTVRTLVEKGFIRTAGRHESLGRPQLYATTKKFLLQFGLMSLSDLPGILDHTR